MKRFLFTLGFVAMSFMSYAQNETDVIITQDSLPKEIAPIQSKEVNNQHKERYKLYETTNRYTFIKLDTRKGHMITVQYGTGENDSFEYSLGSPYYTWDDGYDNLVENGRFTLYPTQNIYNFLLLDQITGEVWQVQWHQDASNRLVIPIRYSYGQ